MKVIVESPFAGGWSNVTYARACLRDCLDRDESPYASHLLYTQKGVLDDKVAEERQRGIDAATVWMEVADAVVVYMDLGVTNGMLRGVIRAARAGKTVKLRWIKEARPEEIVE
jgi:hypothetical protein